MLATIYPIQMKQIKLDHVERLSRGKRSGANIGSRLVGHHLRPHERTLYQKALKKGYLDISERDRDNLWHIWEKACLAQAIDFLVLIKQTEKNIGTVFCNQQQIAQIDLSDAKRLVRQLAKTK